MTDLVLGKQFIADVAARDFPAVRGVLREDVRFRLLTPRGPQAQDGADETLARFVGWLGDARELRLESSSVDIVDDRLVLVYRLWLRFPDGCRRLEQHLVCAVDGAGRLATIDLLCTGFHSTVD
jgi:hypothetical protein